MSSPRHILLIRLSSVGDVILATPVVAGLRHRYPQAKITWLVDTGYLDLLRENPHIDRVLEFDRTGRHRGLSGIRRLAQDLSPVDLLIDLQHKARSVLLATFLRPTRKKSMVKRQGLGLLRAMWGSDEILRAPHQVERYLAVLGSENGAGQEQQRPLLRVAEADRRYAQDLVGKPTAPLVGILPGAGQPLKRWPGKQVVSLIDSCQQHGWQVALLGGAQEKSLLSELASQVAVEPLLVNSQARLGQLAAILACCQAVVSPDSGPAHMAAAMGVPVLTLFGPTSPDRWSPRGLTSRVIRQELACSPCSNHGRGSCRLGSHECLQSLGAAQVFQALTELLDGALRIQAGAR